MKRSTQDVLGWLLAGAGLLALASLALGLAGVQGPGLLRALFGWGASLVVLSLLLGGGALAYAGRMSWQVRWRAVAYGELLLLAALALTQVVAETSLAGAYAGRAGGIVGWAMGQLLVDLIGRAGAVILILAVSAGCGWLLWRALPADWRDHVGSVLARMPSEEEGRRTLAPALRRSRSAGEKEEGRRAPARARPGSRRPADHAHSGFSRLVDLGAGARDLWRRAAGALGLVSSAGPAGAARSPASSRVPTVRQAPSRARPEEEGRRKKEEGRRAPSEAAPRREKKPRKRSRAEETPVRPEGLPPMELLRLERSQFGPGGSSGKAGAAGSAGWPGVTADARQRAQTIRQTLAEFGVPVEVVSIKEGPTVTQFGIEPGEVVRELRSGEVLRRRVSVQSILRLSNDLALALATPSIRIEAPVPGRPYVGIEVPNPGKTLVNLRNILESKEFAQVRSPLAIALGRDVAGDPVVADLALMPHLLIAGATGSGKSVCINALICSLLMNNGPDTVRLLMIDPKMVELPAYNGIPHLLGPVLTDPGQATAALAWLMLQMDDRYRTFAEAGVRNIAEHNRRAARSHARGPYGHAGAPLPLPHLVLVIDELADLMMSAADDVERQICRLAQMSRATGIHLVLATQRPSVDVITGLIKANFPARIAFAVTTQIDSRVILDGPGAEKLLGRGDMLFMTPDSAKLARIQGCFVSDHEIDRLVEFWKAQRGEPAEAVEIAPWEGLFGESGGRDELLEQALRLVESRAHVSTSLLQRQLRIGFPRAARLMEQLEEMGVVGPDEGGGRSRAVLWRADAASVRAEEDTAE